MHYLGIFTDVFLNTVLPLLTTQILFPALVGLKPRWLHSALSPEPTFFQQIFRKNITTSNSSFNVKKWLKLKNGWKLFSQKSKKEQLLFENFFILHLLTCLKTSKTPLKIDFTKVFTPVNLRYHP